MAVSEKRKLPRVRANSFRIISRTFPKPNDQISKTTKLIFIGILKPQNNENRYCDVTFYTSFVDCVLYCNSEMNKRNMYGV